MRRTPIAGGPDHSPDTVHGAGRVRQGAKLDARQALLYLQERSHTRVAIPGTTSIKPLSENWSAWNVVKAG